MITHAHAKNNRILQLKNKIKFTLVGDIFPGNLDLTVGFGIASEFYKHEGNVWKEQIKKNLRKSDVIFGNLESPLLFDEEKAVKTSFAGSYRFANFLKECGFDILSIANNHILEQCEEGFKETIKIITQAGIKPVGFSEENNSNLVVLKKNNVKLGFAAYNSVHDIENPSCYSDFSTEKAIFSLNKMKKLGVDCKIVSLHWGWHEEYINIPSVEQIKIARLLIDNGADIIVGHHPHVIQPVEEYKGKLIIYSLGNFLFDMIWSKNVRIGMAVKVFYDKANRKLDYRIIPIYLRSDYAPSLYDRAKFNKIMQKYSDQMRLSDQSENEYSNKRKSRMKINQYYQRIMMKIFLIRNWDKLSSSGKKQYLNKIRRKLFMEKI